MKRILCLLLVVCMLLTPIPSVALPVNSVSVADYNSLRTALTTSTNGTIVQLNGSFSFSNSITVTNSLILDLNGHTLTFTGTDPERKLLISGILFTGSGTFTVKDSGTDGKLITSETYSMAMSNEGSGMLDLAGGSVTANQEMSCAIVNVGSGTIRLTGARVASEKFYAVINQLTAGRLYMTGGTVSSDVEYGLVNYGSTEIAGGTVSSNTSHGVMNLGSGAVLTISGGTVTSTSYHAISNSGNGNIVRVTGGAVSSDSGVAIVNFNACEVAVSGGTVSSATGMAIVNMDGGRVTISNGATVSANTDTAVFTKDTFTMTGGTVHSNAGIALISVAPAGKDVNVSGGTISSTSNYSAANAGAGTLTISGNAVLSAGGIVSLLNQGTGTAVINGGTLTAGTAELYNSGSGKIVINAGTYQLAVNSNQSGSIVINGGSVKAVQGATPRNNAGTGLSLYGITLTNGSAPVSVNTPVAAGELILSPAVNYGFQGVKTDASGTIYLWLPPTMDTANYASGSIDVTGGISAGKTSVLPNFRATVTVRRNDETWDAPYQVLLSTRSDIFWAGDMVLFDGNGAKEGGVYAFSRLKPGQEYYIWGNGTIGGLQCSGVKVTNGTPNATVSYYDLRVTAGEGISGVFVNATLLQGTSMRIQADVKPDYTFAKWANTLDGAGGAPVLAQSSGNILMNGRKDITAYATLNTYEGTVALNRNDVAWHNSGKTVTLSTSSTVMDGAGSTSVSVNADGVYRFTALSSLATHYVWTDGVYTGKTVTPGNQEARLDYYTVALTPGANITAVSGSGVYLKGTGITISATVHAGDFVFSRWQDTTGGALLSPNNTYAFYVNSAVSLTAVGAATRYSATVTLKKDDAAWTASPRAIVLSTSTTELVGTVTGTVSGNTYTFANLPGAGVYYVWDSQTVTYTGQTINSTGASAELEYFTLTVTQGANIASVTGAGTYLKGISISVSATPAEYYRMTGDGSGTYTIDNIIAAQTMTPVAELDTYTGTVYVNKDNATWTNTAVVVSLSASNSNPDADKQTATGASGVFTITSLDPTKTYFVWVDGVYAGQTVSHAGKTATVDYYTVNGTGTNVSVSGSGVFLKGSDVELTASNILNGFDFIGWKSGSALLSTSMTVRVSNLSAPQALTAEAINTFAATVTLAGTTGRNIQMSTSAASLVNAVAPTGSDPYAFPGLVRGSTYYVFDNGAFTGKTVTKNAPNVTLQYYTVSLTAGPGIIAFPVEVSYLAGSTVTVSASTLPGYVFSGWSDGSSQNPYTITNLSSNKALTANGALSFAGTVSIVNGSILIENDTANAGMIRIKQNGVVLGGGDNLAPNTNIIITGTYSGTDKGISVTATHGAYITLRDLSVSGTTALNGCVAISNSAGDVLINLEGSNTLTGGPSRAGIYKGAGSNKLTITGSGSLTVIGGSESAGIGGAYIAGENFSGNNINIVGGTITAKGTEGGAGIGGSWNRTSGNITIAGGTITAIGLKHTSFNVCGAGIGGGDRGNSGSITITGGKIIAIGDGPGAGIGGGSADGDSLPGNSGSVSIAGGTVTATSNGGNGIGGGKNATTNVFGTTGVIKITGGNVNSSLMGMTPVGYDGKLLSLEASAWSGMPIVDNRGIAYGMNDVQQIDNMMYAYVDRNGYYAITTPASRILNGVAAIASIQSGTGLSANDTINVTVTFTGTALTSGTYTVGLSGTGIGTVVKQTLVVTSGQNINAMKTFSFTMPASDVSDLSLTLSFSEAAKHTVSYDNDSTLLGISTYYVGETYSLMNGSGLEKTGHTFGGWGVSGTQTMGTSDVTHSVVWTPNNYKVVFHSDSATAEQSFSYNAAATALNGHFTRDGYSLSGWATTANGPKAYDVNATVQNLTAVQNGAVNLYAVWQAQTYFVGFDNGGGIGEMTPQSFTHGAPQELSPNAFARIGYTFAGWVKDATTYVNGQSVYVSKDINLTAQWTPNSFLVAFNGNGSNGGTPVANQSFVYDVSQPLTSNTYSRTGYSFAGWATSSDGAKVHDNNGSVLNLTTMQNGNITLYAVWTPNNYTVIYGMNAGTGSGSMNSQTHTYDEAQALAENGFTLIGYSFDGWNTEANGDGLNYADKASVMNLVANGTVTLYAQWVADTYTLDFDSTNGVGSMESQSFATGDSGTVSANRFTKPGYTFTGWDTRADGSGTDYAAGVELMSLDNLSDTHPTLYAQWAPISYMVVYHANGGTASMGDQSFTYDNSQSLTLNCFTRGNHTFLGWSTSSTSTTVTYTNGQSVNNLTTMVGGKVNLYAVWQPHTYSVSFANGGGSGAMSSQSFTYGVVQELNPNAFTRTGHTFTGWREGTATYLDGQRITATGDLDLTAQWVANSYQVVFNGNGANAATTMENQSFTYGVSQNLTTNAFIRDGYVYAGWATSANGTKAYDNGGTVLNLTASQNGIVTLYAIWIPNPYTVHFERNADTASGTMNSQAHTYGTAQTLPENEFTRTGYIFSGWNTKDDGTGMNFADEAQVVNLAISGQVTLYAQWMEDTYEVRFEANGGTGEMLSQTIGRLNTTALRMNSFTRVGYSFVRWNTRNNGSGLSFANGHEVTNLPGGIATSITLYAQWTENVRYNLNGVVRESGGALLSGATVKLMQGSTIVAQTETDVDGSYFFGNLKSGSYNAVAAKDGKIVTALVIVTAHTTQNMVMPTTVTNNSVLVVTNEPNAETLALTVGGLDSLAAAENADITMTVTARTENAGDTEQLAIKQISGSQVVGIFLDMTVMKGADTQTSLASVLEIVIPFNLNGKTDINVYRYHDGQASAFTKRDEKPVSPFADGYFYLDAANELIYVYASRFSTYAVTYTGLSSGGGDGGSGGSSITYAYPVIMDMQGVTGGSVKSDKSMAFSGDEVTLTITPDKGYMLTGLSINDTSGKDIMYTDNGNGTFTFGMIASAVMVRLDFVRIDSTFPFVDVPESHWARNAVAWAYESGLFSGTSASTFGPAISTSRGMVVTVLWRMENEPSVNQDTAFQDVSATSYYGMAVAWASAHEVVLGYGNGLFGPNDTISREQMAAILYRYAQRKGDDVSKRVKLDSFADGDKTSGYALAAMEWAVANNLISGKGNSILDPKGQAARAEVAAILMRFSMLNR